jgi:hypothetical protein
MQINQKILSLLIMVNGLLDIDQKIHRIYMQTIMKSVNYEQRPIFQQAKHCAIPEFTFVQQKAKCSSLAST